jgi:HD superfamily phosphohydrolase/serine/threonine protein kinase
MTSEENADARAVRDWEDFGNVLKILLNRDGAPEVVARRILNNRRDRTRNKEPLDLPAIPEPALRILPGSFVASGGGGLVLQCVLRQEPKVKYALKVVRPSLLSEPGVGEEQKRAIGEFVKHVPLSHQNVARVYSAKELIFTSPRDERVALQYMLVEWIEEAKPLRKYLASKLTPDWQAALHLIIQAFEGLEHLHKAGLVHWDVKSENLLVAHVAHGGVPKLSDLGSARQRDRTAAEPAKALSTRWNVPRELLGSGGLPPADVMVSSRRMPIDVPSRDWDIPWLDLWMLARDLNRLFVADRIVRAYDDDEANPNPQRAEFEKQSTEFLARCFAADDPDARHAYDLISLVLRRLLMPKTPHAPRFYEKASDVIHDLRKLEQPLGAAHRIDELRSVPQRVMRIPIWNNIPYTDRLGELFNSAPVKRLSKHLQLGALVQVYPGASHRRSEHSAGVFAAVCEYVKALYADRRDAFWRINIEARDVDALLLAAVAHDIGHLSFGHFLEEMKGLFQGRMHENYAAAVLAPSPPPDAADVLLQDRAILRQIVRDFWAGGVDTQELLSDALLILRGVNATNDLVNRDAVLSTDSNRSLKFDILHTILDSAIDADKLDYLARDAHHCNVQYSKGVDIDRYLQSLTTLSYVDHRMIAPPKDETKPDGEEPKRPRIVTPPQDPPKPHACIGVTEKGIAPVESILVARYQMFSAVYWQHTARALTATLQFVVQEYVAADQSECDARISGVIDQFRQREDIDAIQWLLAEVSKPARIHAQKSREVLGKMCSGLLGDRGSVYWPAFELRYGRSHDAAELSIGLMRRADAIHQAANAFEYVERCRSFRDDVAKMMSERLRKRVKFGYGDLLIDIPPAGKDQIDNIFVIADGTTRPIQDVSPVADAVRDSFRYWVRKVRVFLSPAAHKRCREAGVSGERLHGAAWDGLRDLLSADVDPQLSFAAAPATPEGDSRKVRQRSA